MPNHVSNKILFDRARADEVFAACCPDGGFDFETLIPMPHQVFRGDLSGTDEKDFPCNWLSWCRENWGTKWGAYDCTKGIEGDRAFIKFDTAWSVPYPVICALVNRFQLAIEHRYFDEGANFWGIERWGRGRYDERMTRTEKLRDRDEDRVPLSVELKGYDPEKDEDAA